MLLQWTPNGGLLPVTLGDNANKFAVIIEQIGGQSVTQEEQLAGGANLALFPRGNIGGMLVFKNSKTYASADATYAQFATEYGRLNQQGTITLTAGAAVLTMANAILKGVNRIFDGSATGARMSLRYTFAITTIVQ